MPDGTLSTIVTVVAVVVVVVVVVYDSRALVTKLYVSPCNRVSPNYYIKQKLLFTHLTQSAVACLNRAYPASCYYSIQSVFLRVK